MYSGDSYRAQNLRVFKKDLLQLLKTNHINTFHFILKFDSAFYEASVIKKSLNLYIPGLIIINNKQHELSMNRIIQKLYAVDMFLEKQKRRGRLKPKSLAKHAAP